MKVTKKSVILGFLATAKPVEIGAPEIVAVHRELHRVLGPQGRVSDRYLIGVLEASGIPVAASVGGLRQELLDILKFDTLPGAEEAIRQLDARRASGENIAMAGQRARSQAELVARNPRVRAAVRQEREEIALWFAIWLQTPEVFFDWLEIRKKSREFVDLFLL